jgi:D-alanyl-D-alanine carboxypeptidase
MIKKVLTSQLPLYVVVIALAGVVLAAFATFAVFRTRIYNYQFAVLNEGARSDTLEFGSWPALENAAFFEKTEQRLIDEQANFVEANLSDMKLSVYRKGARVKEFPILTKGKPGSWWETPAGIYKIDGKIENHFSGFANVYLPWSLPFQGNFFIHGWPYYQNGDPVASQYSGGCIRLGTDDAKELFKMVTTGMPVLVFENDFQGDTREYRLSVPGVGANVYLAADIKNNFVFAESRSNDVVPVASLTKLMTAMVAVEYVNIEREITIPAEALVQTSIPRLKAGETRSLYNLLHPLLLESSNEAAEAIARHMGRERFIGLMNRKAQAIGMTHTVFTDPSGSEAGNIATAQDLFSFAKYLYNNRSFILRLTANTSHSRTATYGPLAWNDLQNLNVFSDYPEFVGGKVGLSTAAGQTILSVFEANMGGETRPIVIIVLGSENNAGDATALYHWVQTNY